MARLEVRMLRSLLREPSQELLADQDPRYGYFGLVQVTTTGRAGRMCRGAAGRTIA
jgi:hypothetical protein